MHLVQLVPSKRVGVRFDYDDGTMKLSTAAAHVRRHWALVDHDVADVVELLVAFVEVRLHLIRDLVALVKQYNVVVKALRLLPDTLSLWRGSPRPSG